MYTRGFQRNLGKKLDADSDSRVSLLLGLPDCNKVIAIELGATGVVDGATGGLGIRASAA